MNNTTNNTNNTTNTTQTILTIHKQRKQKATPTTGNKQQATSNISYKQYNDTNNKQHKHASHNIKKTYADIFILNRPSGNVIACMEGPDIRGKNITIQKGDVVSYTTHNSTIFRYIIVVENVRVRTKETRPEQSSYGTKFEAFC